MVDYYRYFKGNHFSDTCKKKHESRTHRLYKIAQVPIKYHIKIKANANPYLKEFDKYFYGRQKDRLKTATICKQITSFEHKKNKFNKAV